MNLLVQSCRPRENVALIATMADELEAPPLSLRHSPHDIAAVMEPAKDVVQISYAELARRWWHGPNVAS